MQTQTRTPGRFSLQQAVVAPKAPPVAAGVGAVLAAGALLGLVAGAFYLRARRKTTGFGFSSFQVGWELWGAPREPQARDSSSKPLPANPFLPRWKKTPRMTSPHGRRGPVPPWSPSPTLCTAARMLLASPLM